MCSCQSESKLSNEICVICVRTHTTAQHYDGNAVAHCWHHFYIRLWGVLPTNKHVPTREVALRNGELSGKNRKIARGKNCFANNFGSMERGLESMSRVLTVPLWANFLINEREPNTRFANKLISKFDFQIGNSPFLPIRYIYYEMHSHFTHRRIRHNSRMCSSGRSVFPCWAVT